MRTLPHLRKANTQHTQTLNTSQSPNLNSLFHTTTHSSGFFTSTGDNNPVIFLEPKFLYRQSNSQVPTRDYTLPLSVAEVMREGTDVTVIGWGAQTKVLEQVCVCMYTCVCICMCVCVWMCMCSFC